MAKTAGQECITLALAPSLVWVFHIGGLISPTICFIGYFKDDAKTCWLGVSFFIYSWLCILTAATSDPRRCRKANEIARISLAFSIACLGFGMAGSTIKDSSHRLTKTLGWTIFVFGCTFAVLSPLINLQLVSMIANLSDASLNKVRSRRSNTEEFAKH